MLLALLVLEELDLWVELGYCDEVLDFFVLEVVGASEVTGGKFRFFKDPRVVGVAKQLRAL